MTNRVRLNSIIGLALMLSLLAVTPAPTFASCRNSGGSSGSSKFGSQVNGGSVTICASAVAVTPARSATVKTPVKVATRVAAKVIAKVVSKPVAKTITKPKTAFHKISTPKVVAKPVIKKKVATKVISKPSTSNKTAAAADFTPAAVNGNVYPSNELSLGQQASFVSSAVQHYRSGTLLGLPTEVRFTPISVSWNFGDGNSGTGGYAPHSFGSAGVHQVQMRVIYAISYRVKGSVAWISEPDSITVADDLLVNVAAGGGQAVAIEAEADSRVLLVGQGCLQNPGSFGCN